MLLEALLEPLVGGGLSWMHLWLDCWGEESLGWRQGVLDLLDAPLTSGWGVPLNAEGIPLDSGGVPFEDAPGSHCGGKKMIKCLEILFDTRRHHAM